jgi:tRNA threonylcarbamoyladenosine biosynthesis protein TsaE
MPILDAHSLEFFSRSPEQTRRLGIRLGGLLRRGDLLVLIGELGAGKTTFVQGLVQGWGSLDKVSSPTFVLNNVYRRPDGQILNHLDAYRIESAFEAEELDIDLMLEKGALVIEWGERIQAALPTEQLRIYMHWVTDEQRGMLFSPQGKHYEKILAEFRAVAFGGKIAAGC